MKSPFAAIAETGVEWWLQAYLCADRTTCKPLLHAAVLAGAKAIVLTVDTPTVGTKHDGAAGSVWDSVDPRWLQVNFPDGYGSSPGDEKATDLGAHDIAWLRETTGLPVVVKGVLRGDDARRCVDAGASAIWVSNHGGRQLDFLGRLPLYALAVDGSKGVSRLLSELDVELVEAMRLSGCSTLGSVGPGLLLGAEGASKPVRE